MRRLLVLSIVAVLLGSVASAGLASAAPSLSLVWQGSNTLAPGESATLDVVLEADVQLPIATVMVGVGDTTATAPKIIAATNTPPPPFQMAGTFVFTPALPNATQVGAFGGLSPGPFLGPGTFTFGSVTFQAGTATGSFAIDPFQREGIDVWLDASQLNVVIPTLHGTTLNVVPEPGSAALLGLGCVGLVAVGRRRSA